MHHKLQTLTEQLQSVGVLVEVTSRCLFGASHHQNQCWLLQCVPMARRLFGTKPLTEPMLNVCIAVQSAALKKSALVLVIAWMTENTTNNKMIITLIVVVMMMMTMTVIMAMMMIFHYYRFNDDRLSLFQKALLMPPNLEMRTPPQYPKRRLSVRSRKVSKPRDLYLKLSDRSEIWQALRQQCCRCACQISKRCDNLKIPISWLRDFTRSYEKTSFRILRRGPDLIGVWMEWRSVWFCPWSYNGFSHMA